MSTNKHALIRYRVIDKCLRQVDKAWNWKTLAEACAVEIERTTGKVTTLSERTIKGDIQSMRNDDTLGYFAPIEYDRAEKSYYYSDRSYSITEAPLNRSDSEELKAAIGLLRQFTGFQHLTGIENIIQKLELLAFESTAKKKKIVHLAQPSVIPGQQWLDPLYLAIQKEIALTMTYKPFNKEASTFTISPLLLKEYDNRWYVYAMSHNRSQLRTYGLERIQELKETLQEYRPTSNFNPDTYFKDILGVTLEPEAEVIQVRFRVDKITADYVRTKPLHTSQSIIKDSDEGTTFSISVIPNFELEKMLLSYGEQIEILKPKDLRKKIKTRLKEALSNY